MTSYISGNSSPPQSLGLQLQVSVCRSQIPRKVGDYSALFFADGANVQDAYLELTEFDVWNSNPQETYQRLVVSCSGPLLFQGVKADNSAIEIPVDRMLVLDCELKTFKLTNQGTGRVRGNIHFVSNKQAGTSAPPNIPV
jgi:hypothetical protein